MIKVLSGGDESERRALERTVRAGRLIAGAILTVSLFATGSALAQTGKSAATGPELKDITVYSELSFQSPVQLIVAEKKGFFKQLGLNVTPKYYQSGSEVPPGMIGGSIILAHGGLVNPLVVADQGFPVTVISQVADWGPSAQLVVQKELGNVSPKDLAGKTLVGPDIPVLRMFWINWTARNKIDPKSLRWLNAAPSDALTAFLAKKADVLLMWGPQSTKAIAAGGVLWQDGRRSYRTGDTGPAAVYFNRGVVFVATDWYRKYPRTVEAYLRGLYMANEYLKCHREEVTNLVGTAAPIDPAMASALMNLNDYAVLINTDFFQETQKTADFFQSAGILKRQHNVRGLTDSATIDKVAKTTEIPAAWTSCLKK